MGFHFRKFRPLRYVRNNAARVYGRPNGRHAIAAAQVAANFGDGAKVSRIARHLWGQHHG